MAGATNPTTCSEPALAGQAPSATGSTPPPPPEARLPGAHAPLASRAPHASMRRSAATISGSGSGAEVAPAPQPASASTSPSPPPPPPPAPLASCPVLPALPVVPRGNESPLILAPDALAKLRSRRFSQQDPPCCAQQGEARAKPPPPTTSASTAAQAAQVAGEHSPPHAQLPAPSRKQDGGVRMLPPAVPPPRPAAGPTCDPPRGAAAALQATESLPVIPFCPGAAAAGGDSSPAAASAAGGGAGGAGAEARPLAAASLRLPSLPLAACCCAASDSSPAGYLGLGPPAARAHCGWAGSRRTDPFTLAAAVAQAGGGAVA